ncbi:TonB-dependent receptor [Marinomonas atlantica]|uniref:TonB-dependent receptor n=1 Tax=Marinomonas atlantica TaxID=1806668 RepID=UPI0009EEEC8B|nr:TonB-dependent siderophore receptor [Marinomonas atlantica]
MSNILTVTKEEPVTLRSPIKLTALAMAVSSALSGAAYAQENTKSLDALVVEGQQMAADANPYAEPDAPYKANRMSDIKYARDIAETPKTITVLTKDAIEESGKTDLESILSAQPGITLGTGEGGNSFGDRYIIRGYEARSDVYTDGLREPGLITRETFALDQVEITKGPSSTFGGRGTTGGAVNSVTKKASLDDDFTNLSGTLGTDNKQRYTLDTNKVIGEDSAVRFNALYSERDIPDRAPADEQREGFLLSGTHEVNPDVLISADYYYFRADDKDDVGNKIDRSTGNIIDRDYVGQKGLDFRDNEADIATLTVDAYLTNNLRLQNKTRYGETKNDYIVSNQDARPFFDNNHRTFTGWQENEYLGNQTNFLWDGDLFGKRNTVVMGVEYAREEVDAGNYSVNTTNSYALTDTNTNNNLWQGSYSRNAARSMLTLETVSAYLSDTVTLNDDWEVSGGVRYDHFDYEMFVPAYTSRGNSYPDTNYQFSDGFWNGQLGAVYSPWEHGNVYATWSTSSNINGGESDAGTNCGYGGLCTDADGNYSTADPEQSTNYEIGTKWQLMDHKLLLTSALFQITKDDVIEGGNDSYQSGGSLNTGKNRVRGVELGLSGNITDKLSGQLGMAVMDSETLESYNQDNVGRPKANFAEKSLYAQAKYMVTPDFALGGAMTYSSEIIGGQPDAGASADSVIKLPSYTVYDLFATYQVTENFDLQANIQNVTDEDYYTAVYRGGDIIFIGDARSVSLTANYQF